jgi:ribosome-binding ATPase YchF (GTP1/OBG family)
MLVGVCGKTNTGKTTFFSAATLVDAEISNRIFTTIEPNRGVSYVRVECPCKKLNLKCSPNNSKCIGGTRLVPIKVIDIAGLVPGAHEGRGLGNKFLSEIMEASALINVIDAAGSTDDGGNPVAPGTHDPLIDVEFFREEINFWILGIIKRNMGTLSRRMEATKEKMADVIHKQLSGLGMSRELVEEAINETGITMNSNDYKFLEFIELLRRKNKPIIIAANKMDIPSAEENIKRIKSSMEAVPCCAEAELALRRADEKGLVEYTPGSSSFNILKPLEPKQQKALEFVEKLIQKYGSTGIQDVLDTAVFRLLDMIVVYPVENEKKYSDKKGNVLPDAYLMKRGSTALDLAFRVHEDIGKKFVGAVDARTGMHLSAGYVLKNNDIISIRSSR